MKTNKIYNLFLFLISFFILIFFTVNMFWELQENTDTKNIKNDKLKKLKTELNDLNIQKKDWNSKQIQKFLQDFSEAEIFKYINDYIEEVNKASWEIVIELSSISFKEPKKSELGFREVDIDLKLNKVKDVRVLFALLDYFTSPINKYSFFITSFSFPIEKSWPYKWISIPLKMFIK
jgi:hypothetical protein